MSVRIIIGDVREKLRELPDKSVHMVCTSPPYLWQRDYGVDGQIGLEATPEDFVAELVAVFREIRRVLRDDGTLWVNLGDSYAGSRSGPDTGSTLQGSRHDQNAAKAAKRAMTASRRRDNAPCPRSDMRVDGLKPKDLIGVPWRVAFALQADGWWLRRDIIWHKLNPMPESVRDRPTTAHEYLFLFSKSGDTKLWRAADTGEFVWVRPDMAEPLRDAAGEVVLGGSGEPKRRWFGLDYYYDADAIMETSSPESHARAARGRSKDHKWADGGPGNQTTAKGSPSAGRTPMAERRAGVTPKSAPDGSGIRSNDSWHASTTEMLAMRNKRSVWSTVSEAFSEAHFATYPPALIEPAILAGCPAGGVVLDPFGGAGTTGLVAERLGRSAILVELNPDYAGIADRRLRAGGCRMDNPEIGRKPVGPLFDEAAA